MSFDAMLVLVILLLIGLINVFVCAFWDVRFVVGMVDLVVDLVVDWVMDWVMNWVMNWVMDWVMWVVRVVVHEFLFFIFALTVFEVVHWVMRVVESTVVQVVIEMVWEGMHTSIMVVMVEEPVRHRVVSVVHEPVRVVVHHEAGRWSEMQEVWVRVHGTVTLAHSALALVVHLVHH